MEELQGVYACLNDQAKCYKVWIFKAKNKVAQNESKVEKLWVFFASRICLAFQMQFGSHNS